METKCVKVSVFHSILLIALHFPWIEHQRRNFQKTYSTQRALINNSLLSLKKARSWKPVKIESLINYYFFWYRIAFETFGRYLECWSFIMIVSKGREASKTLLIRYALNTSIRCKLNFKGVFIKGVFSTQLYLTCYKNQHKSNIFFAVLLKWLLCYIIPLGVT